MPIYLGTELVGLSAIGDIPVSDLTTYTTRNYSLGDFVDGGYVYYIEGTYPNQHGLMASPANYQANTGYSWGCSGTNVTTFDTVFSGSINTENIINVCSTTTIGAKWCSDVVVGGQSDWYLPSIDELILLYTNRIYVPGILSGSLTFHMSSTQGTNNTNYKTVNFENGSVASIRDKAGTENNYVIPVRYF